MATFEYTAYLDPSFTEVLRVSHADEFVGSWEQENKKNEKIARIL